VQDLRFGLLAFPILLFLAGLLTSLVPGAWLLDALEVRVVNPSRGEVVRVAELFERILGTIGAAALLASFVTLLHTSGYSYEAGILLLTIWAVRLFPPVLGAVCVYRLWVEPRMLPSLEAWCSTEAIQVRSPASLLGTRCSARSQRGSHRGRAERSRSHARAGFGRRTTSRWPGRR